MKKVIGMIIFMSFIFGMLLIPAMGQPILKETYADPVYVDVYLTPTQPLGADWNTGLGGDIITVYAEVTDVLNNEVWIMYEFCNRQLCTPQVWDTMTHLGGDLYMFELPGDSFNGWDYYEASSHSLSSVIVQLYADSPDGGWASYPSDVDYIHIYPAWPPQQINATPAASMTNMFIGDTFWINGTSNYWNSTMEPKDLDPDMNTLFDADKCNVTVKVDGTTFTGKTDADGNFNIQVTAPLIPGPYVVNTTVSNSTANRDVPCVADEIPIQVNAHLIDASLGLNTTTTLPAQQLWANGTVLLDGVPAPAGLEVNVSISGTGDFWEVTTDANGDYAAQITAPNATGTFIVNISAECPTYGITAWNETNLNVVAVPLADLVASPLNITLTGNQIGGLDLHVGIAVHNYGIATAVDAQINIFMDGELLDSSRYTIAPGEWMENGLTWLQVSGTHNISVIADPLGEIEESDETNNEAWKVFTVMPDNDGDGIIDSLDEDDDNDGFNDTWEIFLDTDPLDDSEYPLDTDEDGKPDGDATNSEDWMDNDDDGDDVPDTQDVFPLDSTESADFDGDGIGDNADPDDDSDGLDDDTDDPYPLDTDNDGLVNSMDQDDDGDGIPDTTDTMPLDTDNDGTNNGEDADIDGDGVDNAEDVFPLDENEDTDTDDDGIGNNEDDDDDGDGVMDEDDFAPLDSEISEPEADVQDSSTMAVIIIIAIAAIIVAVVLIYPGFKS